VEFVHAARVVDHSVGPSNPLLATRLPGHACPGVVFGHAAELDEAPDGDLGIDVDHEQRRHVVAARFDEQRDVEHDHVVGLRRLDQLTCHLFADRRMHDCVQRSELVVITEDLGCDGCAIERSVGGDDGRPEVVDHRDEDRHARLLEFTHDAVGVDHPCTELLESSRHGRLPGTDSTSETDEQHPQDSTPTHPWRSGSLPIAGDPVPYAERIQLRRRVLSDREDRQVDPSHTAGSGAGVSIRGLRVTSGGPRRPSTPSPDTTAPFRPPILIIRVGTTAISAILALGPLFDGDYETAAWAAAIVAYTVFRTLRPLRFEDDSISFVRVLLEAGLMTAAVASTGYWGSPLVFSLLTAVAVAGFARGFVFAFEIAIATILAVGIPDVLRPDFVAADLRLGAQWAVEILLVALVAGYTRRLSGEANLQHSLALDRVGRLSDANELLYSLHRVAQDLPASLDLDEALDSILDRLNELFECDAAAILLRDDTDDTWRVVKAEGVRAAGNLSLDDLATPLRQTARVRRVVSAGNLAESGTLGMAPRSGSGIYAPLLSRGKLIGLLGVEHGNVDHFVTRDLELLQGIHEPAALAIDNAWTFARLRTVGADEERTRIARDLHDRIGQSLAYLAFELDRIVRKGDKGEDVVPALGELREDVRGVIREVRDTLYDLRTDVSEAKDLRATLSEFLDRVRDRSQLETVFRVDEEVRLPIPQERELWRIAQEAITNVERHAKAHRVTVTWRCDEMDALLEVSDDGRGFPVGRAGRLDSYGLVGMRERASAIGATFEVESELGRGTRVRCALDRTQ